MIATILGGNKQNTVTLTMRKPFFTLVLLTLSALSSTYAQKQLEQYGDQNSEVPQIISAPTIEATQWRPTPAQVKLVQTQTYAYFSDRDSGRIEDAYAKFSPSQKATVSMESWRAATESFNKRAGSVIKRTLRKVTWYKDPKPDQVGLFAAVDFNSESMKLALHCGYVVWQEQADGSFALMREEDNIIDKATEAKLKPGDLERFRTQFRCQ
jgi:Protein of unknown function (DUF4019)